MIYKMEVRDPRDFVLEELVHLDNQTLCRILALVRKCTSYDEEERRRAQNFLNIIMHHFGLQDNKELAAFLEINPAMLKLVTDP